MPRFASPSLRFPLSSCSNTFAEQLRCILCMVRLRADFCRNIRFFFQNIQKKYFLKQKYYFVLIFVLQVSDFRRKKYPPIRSLCIVKSAIFVLYFSLLRCVDIFFTARCWFYFRGDDGVAHGKFHCCPRSRKKFKGNESRFSPLSRLSRNSAASIRTAILIFFFCLFIYTRRIFFLLLLSNLWLFFNLFSSQLYVNFLPRNFFTYLLSYLCNKYLVASVLSLRRDGTYFVLCRGDKKIRK